MLPRFVFASLCPAVAVLLAGCAASTSSPNSAAQTALSAPLINGAGEVIGEIVLHEAPADLLLEIKARSLPAGAHGFHIHTTGKCDGPDFTTAGGHWNPQHRQHGHENPQGPHAGDLSNLIVAENGSVSFKTSLAGVRLRGGDAPMLDADGAAFVIHAAPDDGKTDPTGNSGARIACAAFSTS